MKKIFLPTLLMLSVFLLSQVNTSSYKNFSAQATSYEYKISFSFKQDNEIHNNEILSQIFDTSKEYGKAKLLVSNKGEMEFITEPNLNNNQSQKHKINLIKNQTFIKNKNSPEVRYIEYLEDKKLVICKNIEETKWTYENDTRKTSWGTERKISAIRHISDILSSKITAWYLPAKEKNTSIENFPTVSGIITELKEENEAYTKSYFLENYEENSKQTLNKYYKIMNENCISKEDFEKEKQELQNRILKMYGIGEGVDTSD